MIDITKVKEIVLAEYPDMKLEMHPINSSNKYEVIESIIDEKIAFRNICSGGDFGVMSDEEFASCMIETIMVQKNGYRKLDRAQILRDKTTIMYMDQMTPTSFHKLTPDELEAKIALYEIRKDEVTKSEIKKVEEKKDDAEE
jgi:hypothetical protein